MKYTYQFVTGETQEIEVTEAQYLALKDADRIEYNNNQTNTRRHISMDMAESDEGMQFADPSTLEATEGIARLLEAMEYLRPDQQHMLRAIYLEGMSVNEYAAACGVTHAAISQRLKTAKNNLKKILNDPYI